MKLTDVQTEVGAVLGEFSEALEMIDFEGDMERIIFVKNALFKEATTRLLALMEQQVLLGRIEEIRELAKEAKRVGGFGTIPNLQNYLKMRTQTLKKVLGKNDESGVARD